MEFKVKLTGLNEARDTIASLAARLKNVPQVLKRGGILMLADAQGNIKSQDSGRWPPQARDKKGNLKGAKVGSLLYRTGTLYRSFTMGATGNLVVDIPGGVRVGSNLMTPDGKYSIAKLQQEGTRYIPARRFLYFNEQKATRIRDMVKTYLQSGGEA